MERGEIVRADVGRRILFSCVRPASGLPVPRSLGDALPRRT